MITGNVDFIRNDDTQEHPRCMVSVSHSYDIIINAKLSNSLCTIQHHLEIQLMKIDIFIYLTVQTKKVVVGIVILCSHWDITNYFGE